MSKPKFHWHEVGKPGTPDTAAPIRSSGKVPARWKRRQHAERQARLRGRNNPITLVPPVEADQRAGATEIQRPALVDHGIRNTETTRKPNRWDHADGHLTSLRSARTCSVCSAWQQPGWTAWVNPYTHNTTCTDCNATRHLQTGERYQNDPGKGATTNRRPTVEERIAARLKANRTQ